jgi:hypothetical protein
MMHAPRPPADCPQPDYGDPINQTLHIHQPRDQVANAIRVTLRTREIAIMYLPDCKTS